MYLCIVVREGMKGWMGNFTPFLTVFQSHQNNGRMMMNTACKGTQFTVGKISAFSSSQTDTAISNLERDWQKIGEELG